MLHPHLSTDSVWENNEEETDREVVIILYFILFLKHICLFVCFWLRRSACWILVPYPGIQPVPTAVEARSPNHWAARREVPSHLLLNPHHLSSLSLSIQPPDEQRYLFRDFCHMYVPLMLTIYLKFFFKSAHHFTENIYLIRKFCYYVNRNSG